MSDIADVIGDMADVVGDSTGIMMAEMPTIRRFNRSFLGVALIIMAIFFLINAVSGTIKYYSSVEDYHSLASNHIRYGSIVNGTIDKWCGPYGTYDNGSEIYLLEVDNGQIIPFITNDEKHKEEFIAYGKNNTDAVEIELEGKIEAMSEDLKSVLSEKLAEEGLSTQYIEKILIRYTLVNHKANLFDYRYKIGIVLGGIGILMLLPEFGDFVGRTVSRKSRKEAIENWVVRTHTYQNPHTAPGQKRD